MSDLPSRYIAGIDLGTTHCVLAVVDTAKAGGRVQLVELPQLVAAGEVAPRSQLPSFCYLPAGEEIPEGSLALPWQPDAALATGTLARVLGARVPGRLVHSAKSWLCHGGVDRGAAILPWGAAEGVPKKSPVDVSAEYLAHIAGAFASIFEQPLAEQDVVVTVPASFDEVARELTVEAAKRAGLSRITLLEEPQAAFYAWLDRVGDKWLERLEAGQRVLVCDVGGGTTDFSLLTVVERQPTEDDDATLTLVRTAVGEHLLLGGDNMDLALAHGVEARVGGGKRGKLDPSSWHALVQSCRDAKEQLLDPDAPRDAATVVVPGRGRGVVGGTLHAELQASEVQQTVLEGFFPQVEASARPTQRRAALSEWGLPFAADAAVTRHLAAFVGQHAEGHRIDAVIFNGGALKMAPARSRILEVIASWQAGHRPIVLGEDPDEGGVPALDLGVAHGAAYFGRVRRGMGVRIRGGTARAWYAGVGGAEGEDGTVPALCLMPRQAEEGQQVVIEDHDLIVRANEPVRFPFYSSSTRVGDAAGALVTAALEELHALPPATATLEFGKGEARDVPVHLEATLTPVGTLDLFCVSNDTPHRWKLAFDLRAAGEGETDSEVGGVQGDVLSDELVSAAREVISGIFEGRSDIPPQRLTKTLEAALERRRTAWPLSTLRELWQTVLELQARREHSGEIEARWLNLSGWCLRPGMGAPGDDWRVKRLWKQFNDGLRNGRAEAARLEWWIMWRRVSGGLARGQQRVLYEQLSAHLAPQKAGRRKRKRIEGPKPGPAELAEMWRLAASLERLPAELKRSLGEALLPEIERRKTPNFGFWAIGRLGARVPLYGPADQVIPPQHMAAWVERLLAVKLSAEERRQRALALALIARASGDRARDVDEAVKARVATQLKADGATEATQQLLDPGAHLSDEDASAAFGDRLPLGLRFAEV